MHCPHETLISYTHWIKKNTFNNSNNQRERDHWTNDTNEWISTTNTIRFNHIRTKAIIILNNRNIVSNVRYTQIMSMRSSVVFVIVTVAVVRCRYHHRRHSRYCYTQYQMSILLFHSFTLTLFYRWSESGIE